jgi:hypothetical protein
MQLTQGHALPCPDDTDYAALALYMQRLAERVESVILSQQALVTDETSQPVGIWVNASNVTVSNGGFASSMTIDSLIYSNVTDPIIRGNGFSPFGGMFPESGVYHVGWQVSMGELGAVDTGTVRTMEFWIRQQSGAGDFILQNLTRKVMASTVVGERFGADGLVVVPELNRNLCNAFIRFGHNNASSQVRINAGGLLGWWRRLGSVSQIEVA